MTGLHIVDNILHHPTGIVVCIVHVNMMYLLIYM